MANLNMYPPRARNRENFIIDGSFASNGAGAINNALNVGLSFQAIRNGVGLYSIQFIERQQQTGAVTAITFPRLLSFVVTPIITGTSPWTYQVQSETVSTDGKVNFFLYNIVGAALADPGAGVRVHFLAHLQNATTV